ncbi:hypothetical protein [Moorena sp. SIO4G3]|uniref:hypothetical protein n=1 Tax=Moorena sp. SIO4G3 TaxID=2607821 RepID=UPI00142BF253|nr:hypothetical protein [Moorena sp. SIO4G3]NEO82248.1 hypothetical protein [Moorena sp. SIO4G3]
MAKIKVNDIKPAGVELFVDDESFIQDLKNDELNIVGGIQHLAASPVCSDCSCNCCNTN